jgi:hypothetical protein
MKGYIGLDISMKETAISIRRAGVRVWRGKCVSDPMRLAQIVRKHAPNAARVIFETGPLSVWFYHQGVKFLKVELCGIGPWQQSPGRISKPICGSFHS